MSSKSDRDNRSNQLNPNNSAYHSSRSGSGEYYDDECDSSQLPSVQRASWYQPMFNLRTYVENEYFACFVSFDGHRRMVSFRIIYEYSDIMQTRSCASESADDLGEEILRYVRASLSSKWAKPLAMSALFNKFGQELVWMTREYSPGSFHGSSWEQDKQWAKEGQEAVKDVRELMSNPSENCFLVDWGIFHAYKSPQITAEHQQQLSDLLEQC